jgi:hypothetical protein
MHGGRTPGKDAREEDETQNQSSGGISGCSRFHAEVTHYGEACGQAPPVTPWSI